jgi:hypothetical protein
MKKTIFAALIALFAMPAVTCGLFPPDTTTGLTQLTEDDPGYITLSVGVSGGRARAMDLAQAQAVVEETGVDADGYFEVVFYKYAPNDDQKITVRYTIDFTAWNPGGGAPWKVRVPIANYTRDISDPTANKAVLFAGRKSDTTLLAIGLLSVDYDLTSATPPAGVSFELKAITSKLSTGVPPAADPSAFLITGSTNFNIIQTSDTIDGVVNPLKYQIPWKTSGITALYKFTNLTTEALANGGNVKVMVEDVDSGVPLEITTQPVLSTAPGAGGTSTEIHFTFDTGAYEGMKKINMEIPVFAVNNKYSPLFGRQEATRWFIRGGLDNNKIDTGGNSAAAGTGGAVLLELVNPDYTTLEIDPSAWL